MIASSDGDKLASIAGRRILVTRAPHQASELSHSLRALGAIAVEVPVLEIAPPQNFSSLDDALQALSSFHWIVFTSANAIRAFVARAAEIGLTHLSSAADIACIGRSTASAARDAGFAVTLVPAQAVGEALATELAPHVASRRVLLIRAEVARDILPEALHDAGASLTIAEAYRNCVPQTSVPLLAQAVGQGIDAAIFTSSSSVTHLAALARAAALPFPLPRVAAVSIGPITSATLREHNWPPAAEAAAADIPSLVAALVAHFAAR